MTLRATLTEDRTTEVRGCQGEKEERMLSAERVANDAKRKWSWRDIEISDREMLRVALIKKYGSLSRAAECLNVNYQVLSDVIGGRRHIYGVVDAIQREMEITDAQVLALWPLLRQWPRKSRMAC